METEIQTVVINILDILDSQYGVNRKITDLGGYIAIIEENEELNKANIKEVIL